MKLMKGCIHVGIMLPPEIQLGVAGGSDGIAYKLTCRSNFASLSAYA